MVNRKSIKGQLIIGIVISFTVLQIIYGVVSYTSMKALLQDNIDIHNGHIADQIKDKINEDINKPIRLVQELKSAIQGPSLAEHLDTIDLHLQSIVKTYDFVSAIRLIDSVGNLVTEVPYQEDSININYSYETFFTDRPVDDEVISSSIYYSSITNQPAVTVALNVDEYLMVMDLNLSLLDVFDQSENDYTMLSISVLDQYGNYLIDTDETNVSQRLRHPLFDTIKDMDESQNYYYRESDQTNALMVTKKVGLKDQWYLVLVEDYDQVLSPLSEFGLYTFFFFSAFFVISLFIILLVMKNIMKDFLRLTKSTKNISEGVYDQASLPFKYVEFQDLNDDFTQMGNIIEMREQTIRETNNSLAETIAQLEEEIEEHANTLLMLEGKEKELERLLNEAKDSNLAKSYFLANMSHEIRTPINGIFGIINLLRMTELNSEQKKYLNTVHSSAETLITILNDILDYSKMELGKVKLNYNTFDLKVTLMELKNLFDPTAMYKGIELNVKSIESENRYLIGDETRLRQILSNLVGNAIKFTEYGSVTVSCEPMEEYEGVVYIEFIVSDTGIGISKENQKLVFNRFVQLDNTINSYTKGTGLGLAISKMLVEQMEGSIRVESPDEGGSRFIVKVPFERGEVMIENVEQSSIEEEIYQLAHFVDLKILIVDDDPTSLFMMKTFFEKMSAVVDVAKDGVDALDHLNSESYDMILMDANMPNMSGFEASKEIRNREVLSRAGKPVPIVAITAYSITDERNEYLSAGMNECISKPIDFTVLLEIVLAMGIDFEIRDTEVHMNRKDIISETLDALSDDSGFDEPTCILILETFVEQAKEILSDMDDLMTGEMDDIKLKALGRHLHKFKGSAGNVRAKGISVLSIEAEEACFQGNIQKVKENKVMISKMVEIYAEYLNSKSMD